MKPINKELKSTSIKLKSTSTKLKSISTAIFLRLYYKSKETRKGEEFWDE